MRLPILSASIAAATLLAAAPADAQRRLELGVDAGATFGLGDESSVDVNLPGSRFRVGFFQPDSRWSVEPAFGFAYSKREGTDGVLIYDLQLGALYHFQPITVSSGNDVVARVRSLYARPFVGLNGFSGGDTDDSELSIGAGLGVKVPWRNDLSWRFEANVGYGFDNEAARLGLLAGLSFFPR
jgi:hypothetical protein